MKGQTMKRFLTTAAVASSIALGACTPPTTQQIQNATLATCNFLPTAVVIASFVPGAGPYLVTANGIAQAICSALAAQQPLSAKRKEAGQVTLTVFVNGASVNVTGHYVK
jgi:predicted lipoprotein